MNAEQIFEVITKLVGKTEPCGESGVDSKRFENMQVFIDVFDKMHSVIDDVAYSYRDSKCHSEKKIADLCNNHLDKMGIIE